MENNMLVGFKRFKSKAGVDCCVLYLVTEATEADKNRGLVGSRTQEVFAPAEQVDYFKPEHIGKDVQLGYEIRSGRAFLSSVSVVNK